MPIPVKQVLVESLSDFISPSHYLLWCCFACVWSYFSIFDEADPENCCAINRPLMKSYFILRTVMFQFFQITDNLILCRCKVPGKRFSAQKHLHTKAEPSPNKHVPVHLTYIRTVFTAKKIPLRFVQSDFTLCSQFSTFSVINDSYKTLPKKSSHEWNICSPAQSYARVAFK